MSILFHAREKWSHVIKVYYTYSKLVIIIYFVEQISVEYYYFDSHLFQIFIAERNFSTRLFIYFFVSLKSLRRLLLFSVAGFIVLIISIIVSQKYDYIGLHGKGQLFLRNWNHDLDDYPKPAVDLHLQTLLNNNIETVGIIYWVHSACVFSRSTCFTIRVFHWIFFRCFCSIILVPILWK